jgi:hypothetical protein
MPANADEVDERSGDCLTWSLGSGYGHLNSATVQQSVGNDMFLRVPIRGASAHLAVKRSEVRRL